MASYAVVFPSWKIFITLFSSGMCSVVWCVSHYVPHAIDYLLISLHLTSVMGIFMLLAIFVQCGRANQTQAHLFPSITLKTLSLLLLCS